MVGLRVGRFSLVCYPASGAHPSRLAGWCKEKNPEEMAARCGAFLGGASALGLPLEAERLPARQGSNLAFPSLQPCPTLQDPPGLRVLTGVLPR